MKGQRFTAPGLALAALLLPACDASPAPEGPTTDAAADPGVRGRVGPEGATLSAPGITVTVPAGAVDHAVDLSIVPTTQPVPRGYRAYSPLYRATPEGLTFARPLSVEIAFEGDVSRAALYWSLPGSGYESRGGVVTGGVLTAFVTHFSTGFVGAPDEESDAAVDGPADAPADAGTDVSLDASLDASPDADGAVDAPADARADAGLDAPRDVGAGDAGGVPADAPSGAALAAECVGAGATPGPCSIAGFECEQLHGAGFAERCSYFALCTPVRGADGMLHNVFNLSGGSSCGGEPNYGDPCVDEAAARAGAPCVVSSAPPYYPRRCRTSAGYCTCAAGRWSCLDVTRTRGCPPIPPAAGATCDVEGARCEYPLFDEGTDPVRVCERGVWWRRPPSASGPCNVNQQMCGAACANVSFDNANCGACGRACAAGQCLEGTCRCPGTMSPCGAACFDLATDGRNCGACGRVCGAGTACVAGACGRVSCPSAAELGCGLVAVAGGSFTLGNAGAPDASPPRAGVTISPFTLDAHEVTVARFRRFWSAGHPAIAMRTHTFRDRLEQSVDYPGGHTVYVSWETPLAPNAPGATASDPACNWSPTAGAREDQPINCVDWVTAMSFCVWDGGRLPTEAEWEFAGRTTTSQTYPWGEAAPAGQLCWSGGGTARTGTCRVGSFPATRGLFDLEGNVAEWAADDAVPFSMCTSLEGSATRDPLCQPTSIAPRNTSRGATWADTDPLQVRAFTRDVSGAPRPRPGGSYGFRCARATP